MLVKLIVKFYWIWQWLNIHGSFRGFISNNFFWYGLRHRFVLTTFYQYCDGYQNNVSFFRTNISNITDLNILVAINFLGQNVLSKIFDAVNRKKWLNINCTKRLIGCAKRNAANPTVCHWTRGATALYSVNCTTYMLVLNEVNRSILKATIQIEHISGHTRTYACKRLLL